MIINSYTSEFLKISWNNENIATIIIKHLQMNKISLLNNA